MLTSVMYFKFLLVWCDSILLTVITLFSMLSVFMLFSCRKLALKLTSNQRTQRQTPQVKRQ